MVEGTILQKSVNGQPIPLNFEVVAEHEYYREGPYAITVHITDTKNETGGVAVSLANIVNVKSEENIEHLALEDSDGNAIEPMVPELCLAFGGSRE